VIPSDSAVNQNTKEFAPAAKSLSGGTFLHGFSAAAVTLK